MTKIFIKNTIDVDVDGLRGVNYYRIMAMYDVIQPEGYATIEHELIDEFEYTWKEIDRDGGIAVINEELKEVYNLDF